MSVLALCISILALGFSAYTFWWLHWRPSQLLVNNPNCYAGHGSPEKLILELPFVFYNEGSKALVVDDLRLRLPQQGGRALLFNATVNHIGTDDGRAFATAFFVGPNQAIQLVCEFQRKPGHLIFEAQDYKVLLEGRLNGSAKWKPLHTFMLRVTESAVKSLAKVFIVHENPV